MNLPALPRGASTIQAVIALLLVAAFIAVLFAPAIFGTGWKSPDPVLTQLLSTLVTLAVGFYLGSSQGSEAKSDAAAAQQGQTIAALGVAAAAFPVVGSAGPASALVTAKPTGTPSDPVAVTEVAQQSAQPA